MPDFMYVPKVADTYTEGAVVMSRDGIGDYKIGYTSSGTYQIRLALYSSDTNLYFLFASDEAVTDVEITLTIPSSEIIFYVTSITEQFNYGFCAIESYTIVPSSTSVTVWSTRQEALDAVSFDAPPSPTSGVVVTVSASPIDVPPSTSGVIVYAIGTLLDPNQQGGTSEPGGGHGTFDDTSDEIPIPPLPSISATNAGFVTLFRPNLNKLQQLGSYLWTNLTDFIDNLNKLFISPMDYMIALNIFPCVPPVDTERPIKIGSLTTTIYMPPVTSQWYEHDCGTIRVNEYWGNALDYSPNTKASAFLPFIGSVQLNVDEIMNHTLGLKYRIDLLSGQCVAMITVDNTVYYQFTGECAVSVPLTGSDWSRIYAATVGAIGTAVTAGVAAGGIGLVNQTAGSMIAANSYNAAAQAGASWAALGSQGAARGTKGVTAMREQMNAAAQGAIENARNAAQGATRRANGLASARLFGGASNAVNEVMNGKGGITHSGTISGSAGMLGVKQPYVLLEFPNQSLADNYRHYVGYPSNIESTLGGLSGYTECEQVLIGIPGTDDELAELQEALKGGVYL